MKHKKLTDCSVNIFNFRIICRMSRKDTKSTMVWNTFCAFLKQCERAHHQNWYCYGLSFWPQRHTHTHAHMFCSPCHEIESFAYIAETINYLYVFWCKSRWPCFTIYSLFLLHQSLFVFYLSPRIYFSPKFFRFWVFLLCGIDKNKFW